MTTYPSDPPVGSRDGEKAAPPPRSASGQPSGTIFSAVSAETNTPSQPPPPPPPPPPPSIRDKLQYLKAIYPYGAHDDVMQVLLAIPDPTAAAKQAYHVLNPDVYSLPYLKEQESLRKNSELPRSDRWNAFQGITELLEERASDVFRGGEFDCLSRTREYTHTVRTFAIDTSAWDAATVLRSEPFAAQTHQQLPLVGDARPRTAAPATATATRGSMTPGMSVSGTAAAPPRHFGSFIEDAGDDGLPAPVIRWAPRALRVGPTEEGQLPYPSADLFSFLDAAAFPDLEFVSPEERTASRGPTRRNSDVLERSRRSGVGESSTTTGLPSLAATRGPVAAEAAARSSAAGTGVGAERGLACSPPLERPGALPSSAREPVELMDVEIRVTGWPHLEGGGSSRGQTIGTLEEQERHLPYARDNSGGGGDALDDRRPHPRHQDVNAPTLACAANPRTAVNGPGGGGGDGTLASSEADEGTASTPPRLPSQVPPHTGEPTGATVDGEVGTATPRSAAWQTLEERRRRREPTEKLLGRVKKLKPLDVVFQSERHAPPTLARAAGGEAVTAASKSAGGGQSRRTTGRAAAAASATGSDAVESHAPYGATAGADAGAASGAPEGEDVSKAEDPFIFLNTEEERIERMRAALDAYEVFDGKGRCFIVKEVASKCPVFVKHMPTLVRALFFVVGKELTGKRLASGLSETPVDFPFFRSKLLSTGAITVRELEFDEEKCSVKIDPTDTAFLKGKVWVRRLTLEPIQFAYIDELEAVRQNREARERRKHVDRRRSHVTGVDAVYKKGLVSGTLNVKVKNVSLSFLMTAALQMSGRLSTQVDKVSARIRNLSISSDVAKIDLLCTIGNPILKIVLAGLVEEAIIGQFR